MRLRAAAQAVLGKYYLYIFIVIIFFVSCFLSDKFFTVRNMENILIHNAVIASIALGMLFVVISGGIDLSVGSVVALSSTALAIFIQAGLPLPLAILLTFCVGAGVGFMNGFFIAYTRIAPLIVTLASLSLIKGAAYLLQTGYGRRLYDPVFDFLFASGSIYKIPLPVIYMILLYLIAHFILSSTDFGKNIYAIGGNKQASYLVGINVRGHLMAVYALCSMLAVVGGIIVSARLMMGTARIGEGYELDAIATAVLGGAALIGGRGSAFKILIAAFILGIMSNILNLTGVAIYYQMLMKGGILLVAAMAQEVEWQS